MSSSNNQKQTLKRRWQVGAIRIHAPNPGEKSFWIYADIAELMGCEYTSEAVERFRTAWKQRALRARVGIDAEADGASFSGGREAIVEAAALLNRLAASPLEEYALQQELSVARTEIDRYVVPDPITWALGDVFAFELADGSHAYGQVVGEYPLGKTSRQATCALLDHRTTAPEPTIENLRRPRVLAVLHVNAGHLTAGEWPIIGHLQPMAEPYSGPCGHPFETGGRSWDGLETLANAYFGLTPWNAFHKDDYLDAFLLPGIVRPATVVIDNKP